MKRSGIYQIVSKLKPHKIYIGSSNDLIHRKSQHFHALKKGTHFNKKLQNHYNKYGSADLCFSIIIECPLDKLVEYEQFYLDAKKTWFNNAPLASNNFGCKHTKEFCKKISEIQKGRKLSEEHKRNIGLGHKGKKHTSEWIKKIADSHRGKKLTEEHKHKLSVSHFGNKNNLGHRWTNEQKERASINKKGFRLGYKHTEEARKKMSIAAMGNKRNVGHHLNQETKDKIGAANKGRKYTLEQRQKMSEQRKGRIASEETKIKMSIAQKKRYENKKE